MTNKQIIEKVNQWQGFEYVHSLTCGNDSRHRNLEPRERGGQIILFCPDCNYIQETIPEIVLSDYVENFKQAMD